MPPPPPPPSSINYYFFLMLLVFFVAASAATDTCTPPTAISNSSSSCPPFSAGALFFPFSASPGCGHPSFHVSCSSPHSLISINNLSFALLHYQPNSTTLFVSPLPQPPPPPSPNTTPSYHHAQSTSTTANCSSPRFPSIPNRPIDFSYSPFRISDASCSRFSLLHHCFPRSSSYSNLSSICSSDCPWECKLINNSVLLLQGCGSDSSPPISEQGCQEDVLDYLDKLLKSGIQIEWDDQDVYFSNCRSCESKNGVCGFNSSDPDKGFLCFNSNSRLPSSTSPWIHRYNGHRIAILSSVFTVTSVAFLVVVVMVIFRWKRLRSLTGEGEEDPTIVFLHRHRSASLLPPLVTYEELESSTNRFDPKRKIGDGGFGSVYLGQLDDRRLVAVKYLHRHYATAAARRAFTTKSFCNEILILSSIDHPNLVKLHGYCSDPRGLLLVYDYVPNGTLADHLHGPKKGLYRKGSPMTWRVRVDIALQTAMAIEYLHFSVQPAIVHRDVTSANIFVEKDMTIKLGDFGLSRLLVFPETTSSSSMQCVWTGPQGTPGYLDPDYHRSFRLTEKSDVYSFGVVLLELISGKKAVDQSRERREAALADLLVPKIQMGLLRQVVDPILLGMMDGGREAVDDVGCGGVGAMAELAFRCVAADKEDRPDAKEVVAELKRIRSRTRGSGGGDGDGDNGGAPEGNSVGGGTKV